MFHPIMPAGGGGAALATPAAGRIVVAAADWRRLGIGLGSDRLADFGNMRIGTVDLGAAIGSRGWWAGFAACSILCGTALGLGLMIPAIPAPPRPGQTPVQRELTRPQAIAPLALGGATGTAPLPVARLVEALAEAPERPRLEVTARIGGDSFESILRRAGVGKADIAAVVALVRPVANLGALPRGSFVDLVLGRRETRAVPRPLETLGFRAAFDLRLAVSRSEDGFAVTRIPIAIDSTPLRLEGPVGGNVGRALRDAGIPAPLAADYVRTMGYAVDFQHGVGRRDRFDIVVARDRAETGDVRYGELLFAGLDRADKPPIELGRYELGGKPQFFKSDGESARKGLMRTPVDGARLTSGFGMRFHPLLAYSRMHQGVDFGAASGSPILAAAGGTITFAGRHGGHGNYLMLRHNNDLSTAYAHLSRFAVRQGQSVVQGQVIGYVGSTGLSTGPHLHYEVWLRGRATNPVALKFIGGTQLTGSDYTRFLGAMARWRGLKPEGSAIVVAEAATEGDRQPRRRA